MKKSLSVYLTVVAAAIVVMPRAAAASTIAFGSYQLHDHPDGAAAQPFYGLRLDGLLGSGIYTFDFDDTANGAAMFLDYSPSGIHIHGSAYGGKDIGTSYQTPQLWSVDFLYSTGVGLVASDAAGPGLQDVWVTGANGANTGTITGLGPNTSTFYLFDYAGSFGYTFRLGDDANDLGHRGFPGISGWGWMNYSSSPTYNSRHVASSDWLFTAQSIPEPTSLMLFATGALALRRRGWSTRKGL